MKLENRDTVVRMSAELDQLFMRVKQLKRHRDYIGNAVLDPEKPTPKVEVSLDYTKGDTREHPHLGKILTESVLNLLNAEILNDELQIKKLENELRRM